MMALLFLLLAQSSPDLRPFRAVLRVEESAHGSDAVTRLSGTLVVKGNGSIQAELPGDRPRRLALLLGLWTRDPWEERFEVSSEAPPGERPLPGGVTGGVPPVRVRPSTGSLAVAGGAEPAPMDRYRLVPREPSVRERHRELVCWVESGRLVRVEAEGPSGRAVCFLEKIREEDR